ncbi:sigma-54 dependent transcriptional regulator [Vibrio sp.]|nr:sigma-54 dependent transcriptional regulator [Vibrio sp.]
MLLPQLSFRVTKQKFFTEIRSCSALSDFSLAELDGYPDWLEELENSSASAAILEADNLSRSEAERLNELCNSGNLDLILLSSGQLNTHCDELVKSGSVFLFREPINFELINRALEDIAFFHRDTKIGKLSPTTSELDQFGLLVGSSLIMHEVYRTLRRVARTKANVLIIGESGAGKELVANTIHLASERSAHPFIAINCGAISPELVDSELFGHEKGSFTGAHKAHDGVFKQAEGGTLFLDEVTEMPIEHQVKLLRALESQEYRPIGSQKTYKADVRIVAATNRDPFQAIEENIFREDLYFRLAQFPIHVPPLREREGDIIGLAKHFLAFRNTHENFKKSISDSALQKIGEHNWPGNVRELKHCIERAYILSDSVIEPEHLLFDLPFGATPSHGSLSEAIPAKVPLEQIEKAAIINTLKENDGNKTDTAEDLGISVKTLYNKLDKYEEKKI